MWRLSDIRLRLQAGAAEKEMPLYKHIAELAGNTKLVSQVWSCQLGSCLLDECGLAPSHLHHP